MKILKFGAVFFTFLLLFFLLAGKARAQVILPFNVYFFYGEGCPHCAKERQFLQELKKEYPNMIIYDFEIYSSQKNNALLQKVSETLNVEVGGVPFLVVGNKGFVGFADGFSDQEIESRVKMCTLKSCPDSVLELVAPSEIRVSENKEKDKTGEFAGEDKEGGITEEDQEVETEKTINLPFFGAVNAVDFSLPVLTIVLAGLDGFNPCAMWTLLFLISLLLGMKNKKRMWGLGVTFIVASALVYFLFLSAWLNLFLFIGLVVWVRFLIGLAAFSAGLYYLRDYLINRSGACRVMGDKKRQKIFEKIKNVVEKRQFVFAFFGIILLAVAVNMVELVCSAGLPAVYTKILSFSRLPSWQYYLYLILYILVFMLDDLIIFFTAMITLKMVGIQGKYSRYSHLIGGLLMIVIGFLLFFKPEWLMFG